MFNKIIQLGAKVIELLVIIQIIEGTGPFLISILVAAKLWEINVVMNDIADEIGVPDAAGIFQVCDI